MIGSIALSDSASVRRDKDGVPVALRIFRKGTNLLTQDGQLFKLDCTPDFLRKVLDHQALKGEAIPVDAEHFLKVVADAMGMDEGDVVKAHPKLGEMASEGLVTLTEENGELWATVVKWAGRARQLLAAAGDKLYAYVSPVIRGLKDGNLRITSLALTNAPALNDQDVLAAKDFSSATEEDNPKLTGAPMKNLIQKLAGLLGMDAVALTAESADLTPLLTKVEAEITAGRAAKDAGAKFLKTVKDALALKETDTLDTAAGSVMSLAAKATSDAAALTAANSRISGFEKAEKARLIEDLRKAGKLTEAMAKDWAPGLDMAALTEWSKHAPVIVPATQIVKPGDKPAGEDSAALTDEEKRIALSCGADPEKVAKVKIS